MLGKILFYVTMPIWWPLLWVAAKLGLYTGPQ